MTAMKEYDSGRTKTIVGMAVSFTAMLRVFEKGQGKVIENMIEQFLMNLPGVRNQEQFDALHDEFCMRFIATIQRAKAEEGQSRNVSYGQAAKVLDVALKACVDFCLLPNAATSQRIKPFLHAGIDKPILKYLKKEEQLEISASSVGEIDRQSYQQLQAAVARQIKSQFGGSILPVTWDNVMWRSLNGKDPATELPPR